MSQSTAAPQKAQSEPSMGRLVLVLCVISVCTALLLGLANQITKPYIDENTRLATEKAMAEVLPAENYTQLSYGGGDAMIKAIYQAGDAGYVVEVLPSGFGGNLDMMVGVDASQTVTGVSIISHSETSGLGANATDETWRSQFQGKSGVLAVTKDGGEINAITGATITSRAVTSGVNAALAAVASLS